jgi:Heterokaryon incompatibility protein (HET)
VEVVDILFPLTTSDIMEASLVLPSASTSSLQKQSSSSKPKSGTSLADVTPLEVLNSIAAKEIYSRLNEDDIRFVVLQAGEPTDPVQCMLMTGHLDALPKYEAVSYVWGSQENSKTIHLNGQALFITQNLHQALIRLRKPAEDRLIWIDALAINQSDTLERNTQVRKMLIIYRSAHAILSWIGQGDEDLGGPTEAWGSAGYSQGLRVPDWDCIFDQVHDQDYLQLFFSFKWLNEYEFWSRAWIIQEITHSNAVFILGLMRPLMNTLVRSGCN